MPEAIYCIKPRNHYWKKNFDHRYQTKIFINWLENFEEFFQNVLTVRISKSLKTCQGVKFDLFFLIA